MCKVPYGNASYNTCWVTIDDPLFQRCSEYYWHTGIIRMLKLSKPTPAEQLTLLGIQSWQHCRYNMLNKIPIVPSLTIKQPVSVLLSQL